MCVWGSFEVSEFSRAWFQGSWCVTVRRMTTTRLAVRWPLRSSESMHAAQKQGCRVEAAGFGLQSREKVASSTTFTRINKAEAGVSRAGCPNLSNPPSYDRRRQGLVQEKVELPERAIGVADAGQG